MRGMLKACRPQAGEVLEVDVDFWNATWAAAGASQEMPRPKENFMDAEVVDFERGSHQIHPPDPHISWALGGYNIFPFPGHPTPRSRIDSSGFELAKRSSRRAERSCFGKLRLRRGNGPGLFCFLGVSAADGHDIRFAAPRKPWSFFHDSILRKSVNTSEQWSSTVGHFCQSGGRFFLRGA